LAPISASSRVLPKTDARGRVEQLHKKVKGFQPLQMTWGRFIIDAVFRGGKKHSNHGKRSSIWFATLWARSGNPIVWWRVAGQRERSGLDGEKKVFRAGVRRSATK
jgi:hypothetical protein